MARGSTTFARTRSILTGCSRSSSSGRPAPSPPLPTSPSSATRIDPAVKRMARARRFADIEALLESRKREVSSARNALAPRDRERRVVSIIASYGHARMLPQASRTFDQVRSLTGAPPTAASLNALLTAHARSGPRARDRVPSLLAGISRRHSIRPDAASYGIVISCLCASGETKKAREVLEEMESASDVPMSPITYTPLLDKLYEKNRVEEAEALWREMVARGCPPDVGAYNVRAKHCARDGKPGEVMRVIEEMQLTGLMPDIISYNLLISCYCKSGDPAGAKKVYRNLWEKGVSPNAATYRNLMYYLCNSDDFDAAFDVCKDGIRKNMVPDIGPLKLLLQGLVKTSREKNARWLIGQVRDRLAPSLMKDWVKVEDQLGLSIPID